MRETGVCTVKVHNDRIEVDLTTAGDDASFCPTFNQTTPEQITDMAKGYWKFVNDGVQTLSMSSGPSEVELFFQDLSGKASECGTRLLGDDIAERLWSLATSVERRVIRSEMWDVPWKSCFYGDVSTGSFLSDNCLVSRVPYDTQRERKRLGHADRSARLLRHGQQHDLPPEPFLRSDRHLIAGELLCTYLRLLSNSRILMSP